MQRTLLAAQSFHPLRCVCVCVSTARRFRSDTLLGVASVPLTPMLHADSALTPSRAPRKRRTKAVFMQRTFLVAQSFNPSTARRFRSDTLMGAKAEKNKGCVYATHPVDSSVFSSVDVCACACLSTARRFRSDILLGVASVPLIPMLHANSALTSF